MSTFIIIVNAQKADPDFIDGQVYISLSKVYAEVMPKTIGGIDEKGEVDINEFGFLQKFIEFHGITRVCKPCYNMTKSDNAMRLFKVYFNDIYKADDFVKELSEISEIRLAEKVPLPKMSFVPNDPNYNCTGGGHNWNWHLDVINAEQAWDLATGSLSTIVTVIDNGIQETHEDLVNMVVCAYDATTDTEGSSSFTGYWEFGYNHGTHTAGLAGAETNNDKGVASIGNGIGLYTAKVGLDWNYVLEAINWAIGKDPLPKAISLSCRWFDYVQAEAEVYHDVRYNYDIIVLAAAGNDGDDYLTYPACYDGVISVASTEENDVKSGFSNYGPNVDVCAPGGLSNTGKSILSSTAWSSTEWVNPAQYGITGNYNVMSGTSMATPIAAGLVGLMRSAAPSVPADKIEACLFVSCDNIDDINPIYAGQLGHGRINAYKAVQNAIAIESDIPVSEFYADTVTIAEGETVFFTDNSIIGDIPIDSWSWVFEGGVPGTSSETNPQVSYYTAGTYQVSLTVTNSAGTDTKTKTGYITVFPMGNAFSLDFELPDDYVQFFPPWKNIDNDGLLTKYSYECDYPGEEDRFGFMAFNPVDAGFSLASPHNGERCGMAMCPDGSGHSDDWLISDKISITSPEATIKFWVLDPKPSSGYIKFNLLVSTTNDELSEFVAIASDVEVPDTWTQMTYSLAAYQGMDIYVAIQNISYWGNMFFIDDIEITGTVSANEIAGNHYINIFPVPANDKIIITNAGNSTIEISDINGRIVLTEFADSDNITLNLSSLTDGVYIARIFDDRTIITKKIILE